MKIYCLSGLGADFSAFRNLRINAELVPMNWLPVDPNESLDHYCDRMISAYINLEEEVNLMGVSFGGTVAQTISRKIKINQLILISTITNHQDLTWYMKFVHFFRLENTIPVKYLNQYNPVLKWSFGIKSKRESALLRKIIKKTDVVFAKWAIQQLLSWNKAAFVPQKNLRLHGTNDLVLPIPKKDKQLVAIQEGSHLMILNKGKELSVLINQYLSV